MEMQARIWFRQCRFDDANSEDLRALEIYEKLGAVKDAGRWKRVLQRLNKE